MLLFRSRRHKPTSRSPACKKWVPEWPLRPRACAPKARVMATGVRDEVATSIPVSCDGVKMHVFMDDSTACRGQARRLPHPLAIRTHKRERNGMDSPTVHVTLAPAPLSPPRRA